MGSKVTLISGTDYNINGICELGELNKECTAEVVRFNKFGYVSIGILGKDKFIKRHLSDCEDIRSITIGSAIRNMVFSHDRWVIIHEGAEPLSEDVYVLRTYNNQGKVMYLSRSTVNGRTTEDITKAWFTFMKEQAVRYATKMTLMYMHVFEAVNVEDVIQLQHYE